MELKPGFICNRELEIYPREAGTHLRVERPGQECELCKKKQDEKKAHDHTGSKV